MTNIFVARLDYGVTQEELKSAFEQYGQVNKVSLAIDKETGKSKGFAFIEMRNNEEAVAAIKGLDGQTMHGRQIAVKQAEDRSNGAPKREFNNNSDRKPFVRENREPREGNNSVTKKEHDDDDDLYICMMTSQIASSFFTLPNENKDNVLPTYLFSCISYCFM